MIKIDENKNYFLVYRDTGIYGDVLGVDYLNDFDKKINHLIFEQNDFYKNNLEKVISLQLTYDKNGFNMDACDSISKLQLHILDLECSKLSSQYGF